MGLAHISLEDRFDLEKSPVLLNGTQALVRLIDCDDPGILLDIDRRSDLTRSA